MAQNAVKLISLLFLQCHNQPDLNGSHIIGERQRSRLKLTPCFKPTFSFPSYLFIPSHAPYDFHVHIL